MKRHVGTKDRVLRGLASVALLLCAVMAPLPLGSRITAFGVAGVYFLFTALAGTCFGYRLSGRSTCPVELGR